MMTAAQVGRRDLVLHSEYDALTELYEWLVPESLLDPAGAVAAFQGVIEEIPAEGRILDCAAGTGQLAVGLAMQGYDVVASDISPAMIARTRDLAREHGVALEARVTPWDDLVDQDLSPFDAVFCVGN